jgi:large subunit ribosomal protein L15
MQLHKLKPNHKLKKKKRVGRGGKRGTYSGRGIKGQKSRSGSKRKPGFEGGKTPLWRQLSKKKGFKSIHPKPIAINLNILEKKFSEGDLITPRELRKKDLVDNIKLGAKILGQGEITKKLIVKNCLISKSAKEKIEKAGGKVS